MNKFIKYISIIIVIIALSLMIVACNPVDDGGDDIGTKPIPTPPSVEGMELAEKVSSGLKNTGNVIASQKIRHAVSEYTIIVNQINLTILYEADYNLDRKQDSEIMLKVYNNQLGKNTLFLYYYQGTLYYEVGGARRCAPNFGGTSYFDMFFDFVSMFDMEGYFFADAGSKGHGGFVEEDDDLGLDSFASYLSMIILGAESKSLSVIKIGEKDENITIKDVSLDSAKEKINDFFQNNIKANIGTRLDALSDMLLGIKISDIGNIGIGILDASLIEIIMRDNAVTDLSITFEGIQTDNINNFIVNLEYSTSTQSRRIVLDKLDDPAHNMILAPGSDPNEHPNGYWQTKLGEIHYVGELYVDALDDTFATEIKGRLNDTNNALNEFILDIRNKTQDLDPDSPYYNNKSIVSIFYNYQQDQTMYIDIAGLMGYIGNGVDLAYLNFPRVKVETINLAQDLSSLLSYIQAFGAADMNSTGILGMLTSPSMSGNLKLLLSKISSKGNVIELNLDTQLLTKLMGDYSTNIVQWLSTKLGMGDETINNLMGVDAFDDINMRLSYNTATGEIKVALYNGVDRLFIMSLFSQMTMTHDFSIQPPTDFDAADYQEIGTADAVNMHFEAELTMQSQSSVDFSQLMGVFIGDVTGANTPFKFEISDSFYLSLDTWQKSGISYIYATLWYNPVYSSAVHKASNIISQPLLRVYTSQQDPNIILIDSADGNYADSVITPVKYRMTRKGINDALDTLLGKNNAFSNINIMETYQALTKDTKIFFKEDHISFTLSPHNMGGIIYDPIYELIGIESMIASCMVQIKFQAPNIQIDERQFVTPEIESLEDVDFRSMYEARWHDSVDVYFGDSGLKINYKLTFQGESAELVTGVYHYNPIAKLMGEEVSYVMILTDETNGTKRIVDLKDSIMTIDPTVDQPIPTKIGVYYDDNTQGEQPFEIVGFPYTQTTIKQAINGVAPKDYTIIIGKGSIAETRFILPIEILGRMLQATSYVGNIPIVGELSIDPYDYSLKKKQNPNFDPLDDYRIMELSYYSNRGSDTIVKETTHLDWIFDESLINYRGGVYYIKANINSLTVALQVNIFAKIVDHILIVGENKGEYTIDSLLQATYRIPTSTTINTEVRIYFQSKADPDRARYRIIGAQPEGWVNNDVYCDGYYPMTLSWLYPVADNVVLDRTINPLNGGRTNINETIFGDNIAGSQQVKLTVLAPSRRLSYMNDNVQCITELAIYSSGGIDEVNTTRESIRISAVGFGAIGSATDINGTFFKVDPYASNTANRLPASINMWVEYAGMTIRKSYIVNWIASSIIDSSGNVLHPTSEESMLRATGWIGDDTHNRQMVTLVIHNLSGAFERLEMSNPNSLDGDGLPTAIVPENGKYIIDINPYDDYKLPSKFTLHFSTASQYAPKEYDTAWTIQNAQGDLIYVSDGYAFPYSAGEYELTTYIAADPSSGILAQTVRLYIRVADMTVIDHIALGLFEDIDNGNTLTLPNGMVYAEVDTYNIKSSVLLDNLRFGRANSIGIRFLNNNMVSYGVPVEWENLYELITVLESSKGSSSYADGIITLEGKVYKGSVLEQSLFINFKVIERTISGISFTLMEEYIQEGIVSINMQLKGQMPGIDVSTITLTLKKPFQLINKMGYLGYSVGENLDKLASNFINEMFAETRLIFGGISERYQIHYQLPADFDARAFNFAVGADKSSVVFRIDKLSDGSCSEGITVYFETIKDTISQTEITRHEETYNDNGSLKYSNETGYTIPSSIKINYEFSGEVIYTNLQWRAKVDHSVGGKTILPAGGDVTTIPTSLFKTMEGNTIWLFADLEPQQENISLTIRFYAKNIDQVAYNAKAENGYNPYSIEQGKISIANVYEVYPFDASRLPNVITPRISTKYQIDDDRDSPITYAVVWKPAPKFADDNDSTQFSQQKINAYINYMGYMSDYDGDRKDFFATAEILMYNSERQEIKLFIEVAELLNGQITHSAIDIVDNHIELDPYVNNFQANYVLPKDINVIFENVSYKFNLNSNIFYTIYNKQTDMYDIINSIPYTHKGHSLPIDLYGEPTDVLTMMVTLPDGQQIDFTMQFMSREFDAIHVDNHANNVDANGKVVSGYLEGVYYIDPYDIDTFQVPVNAEFHFLEGEPINLPITYWNMQSGAPFDSSYKLIWSADTYKGGTYTFSSSLSGYGVAAQEFSIKVIILDRSLKNPYNATHRFRNPIAGLVKDIPSNLIASNFVNLDAEIYNQYNEIATPIIPTITWYLTNDDIHYNGIDNRLVDGALSYNGVTGESAKVTISAPKWTFIDIEDIDSDIIEFNPHTLKSVNESFYIRFAVSGSDTIEREIFHPLEWAVDGTDDTRMIIDWGDRHSKEDKLKTLTLGNAHKSLRIQVVEKYRYSYRQINITEISFGFGVGYDESQYVELVIDPLNPIIPTTALARGVDVTTGLPNDLGVVEVRWDSVIHDMPITGGLRTTSADLVSTDGTITKFQVQVHYLDRTPLNIYTDKREYSSGVNTSLGFPLRTINPATGTIVNSFIIDPISDSTVTYNSSTQKYILPSNVTITFRSDYESDTLRNALNILGANLKFNGIVWNLDKEIDLKGTIETTQLGTIEHPIKATFDSYYISYTKDGQLVEMPVPANPKLDARFDLSLNVICREVERTSISEMFVPADGSPSYQRATSGYFIDPYAVSFPNTITIKVTDDSIEKVLTDIEWEYDADYLKRPDVISGLIAQSNPDFMNITAYVKVRGTRLGIKFPIKPRHIDTTMPGSAGTQPISGGKIYVLAGKDLRSQLPKFLHYKFIIDGVVDVAAVPLTFTEANLYGISTDTPGAIYTEVSGSLGIDKGNIMFTIEVIDPLVFNIKSTLINGMETFTQGGFIYDNILVAINSNNYYIEGKEQSFLPNQIIINNEGHYLTVVDRVYNISAGYVTFHCNYVFLSASDSSDLSGSLELNENSDRLSISFNVPIKTYNHTRIDDALLLTVNKLYVPLGQSILASAMPKAYIDGKPERYDLIWDMSNLQINKAGEYVCYGYYKTTYDNDVPLALTVIVEKITASDSDITISNSWLNREYTGEILELISNGDRYLTISEFLRADGTYGQVDNYIVEYSYDNGISWIKDNQPVDVLTGGNNYRVRITIDDYNVQGSRVFVLTIRQKLINAGDVTFHQTEDSISSTDLVYEYNGTDRIPFVKGIPQGAVYNIRYEQYIAETESYVEARPLNAGTYRVIVTIPVQRNFQSTVTSFTARITIMRKNVNYEVQNQIVYNGKDIDAIVLGLPEVLGDVRVTYIYYDADGNQLPAGSKVKNVGQYFVTVQINGGVNYPSANEGGNVYGNLIMARFDIIPKKVIMMVNELESEYLEQLHALNSAVTFMDADNPNLPGLQGNDTNAIFRDGITVYWEGGALTYKHMVGDYTLIPMENLVHQNYDIVSYIAGTYHIVANAEGAVVINNKAELDSRINNLADNDRVKWYLRAGHYGSIVINKNATVSIVGSYNLSSGEDIAVTFDSITVRQGGVTIDIIKMAAAGNTSLITIEDGASDVTVSRSLFHRQGSSFITGSVAIKATSGYTNTLNIAETTIKGFAMATYMLGGSVDIQDSVFDDNIAAVQVRNADKILLINNQFLYTRGAAVYIACSVESDSLSINDNDFIGNVVALKTYAIVNHDLLMVQNRFKYNSIDVQNII